MIMELSSKKPSVLGVLFDHFRWPLLVLIALAVLALGYFLALGPAVAAYRENYALLKELNGKIAAAKGDLDISKKFSAKIFQPAPLEIKLLKAALPDRLEDSALVAQLAAIAERAGFVISSIGLEESKAVSGSKSPADHVGKVIVRLKINGGGYDELRRLFGLMEASLMIIDVNSVNFDTKSPVYDLVLTVYYYKQ